MKQIYFLFLIAIFSINAFSQCSVAAIGTALDCSGTNGKITINATGGTAPYTYSIDNGATISNNPIFNNLTGGNYVIVITDDLGCTAQTWVDIPGALSLYVVNSVENCTNTPGQFDLIATLGTSPYEYSIDNGTNFTNTTLYPNLSGGNYNVIVRDADGCIATSKDTVPFPLEITNVAFTQSCAGDNSGTISIAGAEGAGNFTYSFDGGANYSPQDNVINLAAGTFNVIIRDVAGCTIDTNIIIDNFPDITPSINTEDVPCNGGGGEVDVVFSGVETYTFSIDGGVTIETGQSYNNNTLLEGDYNLDIVNSYGCDASFNFSIGVERIEDSISMLNAFCDADNGEINAVGYIGVAPFEYSIDNGVSFLPIGLFNNLSQNTYIVHVKDAIGCLKVDTIEITNFGGIEGIASEEDTICAGSNTVVSVNHNGGSGVLYNWNNALSSNQNNTVSPTVTTEYSVVITDVYGCKDTVSTRVVVNEVPDLEVNQNQFLACIGDTIQIVATGADQYNWSTGETTSIVEIEVEGVTTYNVIGNIGNCLDEEIIDVIIKPMPTLVMDANKTSIDTHDSIFFYSSGSVASNYNWDFKDGYTSTMSNPYHKFDFAGAYLVELTVGMGGCELTDTILVYVGTVDIDEIKQMNILVYPNPTQNLFILKSDHDAQLSIFNLNGKVIKTEEIFIGDNKILIEDFPKGIYVGQVKSQSKFYQFKLVVD